MRLEGLSSSVPFEESSWQDFKRPVRSRSIGGHVHDHQVRGIKQAGHRLSSTMSREWKACPLPSGTRNLASRNSSIWYEVVRKECMFSSIWYRESRRRHFVRPVRSRAKGDLVHDRRVRGIKQAGYHQSGTKLGERWACPRPSCRRNQVGRTSSIRYEVKQKVGFFSTVRYEESS